MGSVAGVASAGASLSTALFDIIAAYRDAPRDIAEMARGVSDLSLVLDHLIDVIREGEKIYRRKLLWSVDSAIQRIDDVHEEIWHLVDAGNGSLARMRWVFRRSKTSQLLFKIEAHKSTLQIVTTTLLLAVEQRKISKLVKVIPYRSIQELTCRNLRSSEQAIREEKPFRGTRRRLRRQAENLVQSAHQSLRDLTKNSEPHGPENPGGAPNRQQIAPPKRLEDRTRDKGSVPDTSSDLSRTPTRGRDARNDQVQQYKPPSDDTALWLYRQVFSSSDDAKPDEASGPTANDSNAIVLRDTQAMNLVASRRAKYAQVVDDLLWDWTGLSEREIEETSKDDSSNRPSSSSRPRTMEEQLDSRESITTRKSRLSPYPPHLPIPIPQEQKRGSGINASERKEPRHRDRSDRSNNYSDREHDPERKEYRNSSHTFLSEKGARRVDRKYRDEGGHGQGGSRSPRPRKDHSPDKKYSGTKPAQDDPYDGDEEYIVHGGSPPLAPRRRLPRKEKEETSRTQKAAMAALVAGAVEAFRVSKEPGGWDLTGEKSKRVLTAAAGAATFDPSNRRSDKSPLGRGR
ncbi:hypothetical protein DL771_007885 [Monosporascus sp. 5C6A]|nr:hypothetical protein DL771_007885 [Monosporascus sp. 5C6A]